jgi:subfamily B ATP-binding cassette protein MsbA
VAFALVASIALKGIFDYAGTYLVSSAGYDHRPPQQYYGDPAAVSLLPETHHRHLARPSLMTPSEYTLIRRARGIPAAGLYIDLQCTVIVLGRARLLLLFLPAILVSSTKIRVGASTTHPRGRDKLADIQGILHETITRSRIVKAFGMESWRCRFHSAASAYSAPIFDRCGGASEFAPYGHVGAVAIACCPARKPVNHNVTGTFLAFIVAVFKLYDPVRKFALFNNSFQQAVGASSEIFKFMDTEDDVREKPGAKPLPAFSKSIVLENATFSYEGNGDGAREILHEINLEVNAGEVLAIVGSSGAGKSTLVHLLPRFFDLTSGRLLVDGLEHSGRNLASLRVNRHRDPGNGSFSTTRCAQ